MFGVFQTRSRNGYSDGTDMRSSPSPDGDKEILAHFLYGSTDLESTFRNFNLKSFHRIGFILRKLALRLYSPSFKKLCIDREEVENLTNGLIN